MFQLSSIALFSALGLAQSSIAQFLPPVTYDKVLNSPINPNITISYKTPDPGTCTTVFENQTQYTGYVTLPPYTLAPVQQNYTINTFFWFVESRTSPETAPLTIWLNGGPGSSSMIGFFTESGPCEVVPLPDGSYGTQSSLWGWDRSSNVLFIDQPTQTGFSYDERTNVTLNLTDYSFQDPPVAVQSTGHDIQLNGTLSTGQEFSTQNTSVIAASASWHFLQGFLSAFPQYNPGTRPNSTTTEPTGIHLFAESYGGQYGPAFADFFESQNAKRLSGELSPNSSLEVKLTTLGIINGLVDELIQAPWWPKFAFNNTYEVEALSQTDQLNALSDFRAPGGCSDLIGQCRNSLKTNDPLGEGDEQATNELCSNALTSCNSLLEAALTSGRSPYDIRIEGPDSFPSYAFMEYLNTASVQQSIGAGINFTQSNFGVFNAFAQTGDEVRGTQLASLSDLLAKGIQVAFIYGDADIICNWKGGEEVALEVARLNPSYSAGFPAAGYADIVVNSSYVGGQVRQFGNLSFARIFDAGHTVPAYQPETAFTVFTRIINGDDIGMGKEIDRTTFGTEGPSDSTRTNKVPKQPGNTCWLRAMRDTCTSEELSLIAEGKGVVKDGVFYEQDSDMPVLSSVLAGKPGSLPPTSTPTTASSAASSVALTGVYTATETPRATSGAVSLRSKFQSPLQRRQFIFPEPLVNSGFKAATIGIAAAVGSLFVLSGTANAVLLYKYLRERQKRREEEKDIEAKSTREPSPVPVRRIPEPARPEEETPPIQPLERRATRRPSTAMEPIPEVASARTSTPPDSPRRLSQHANEPLFVQRNAEAYSTPPASRKPSVAVTESPREMTPAASRRPSETPVPQREATPPVERQPSVVQPAAVERRATASPKEATTPPGEPTPPPEEVTPPPKEATPPPREPTPLPTESSPAPQQPTPPTEPSPPPKEPTPPPKQPTPPPKEPTPPRDPSPPPKEPTPPPKEPTPPPEEPSPPPPPRRATTQPPAPAPEPEPEPAPVQRSATAPPEDAPPQLQPVPRKTGWLDRLQRKAEDVEGDVEGRGGL